MNEREEPTPPTGGEEGSGDSGDQPAGGSDDLYTPTNLGDYEIREGEYGPLERPSSERDPAG